MNENTGFAAYVMFNAIKLHFTSSYDYFKYHGKTKTTPDQFLKHKNKFSFYKLSRRFSLEQLRDFYVSNFICQDVVWIGDMIGPEGEDIYKKWQKRIQSLSYVFDDDLESLLTYMKSPDDIIKVNDGNHPRLLTMTMSGDICLETICILNDMMKFLPMWSKKIDDDIIWPRWRKKIEKYTPFIDYDNKRISGIIKEKVRSLY